MLRTKPPEIPGRRDGVLAGCSAGLAGYVGWLDGWHLTSGWMPL